MNKESVKIDSEKCMEATKIVANMPKEEYQKILFNNPLYKMLMVEIKQEPEEEDEWR